jgi:hypothetical protein
VSTILKDDNVNSLIKALQTVWFNKYGYPSTIFLKQGKVQVSKLEENLNKLTPLDTTVTCKSRVTMFNSETEQQWKQNQQQLSEEEFINMVNFFHDFKKPELEEILSKATTRNYDDDDKDSIQENKDETEGNFGEVFHLNNDHLTGHLRRKTIGFYRHKLQ